MHTQAAEEKAAAEKKAAEEKAAAERAAQEKKVGAQVPDGCSRGALTIARALLPQQ
jgi:membrane protein involved in colicin uptake